MTKRYDNPFVNYEPICNRANGEIITPELAHSLIDAIKIPKVENTWEIKTLSTVNNYCGYIKIERFSNYVNVTYSPVYNKEDEDYYEISYKYEDTELSDIDLISKWSKKLSKIHTDLNFYLTQTTQHGVTRYKEYGTL
jgi:hypothetical protein